MAETNQTQREEELARREALLAQREAQLEKEQAELAAAKAQSAERKKTLLDNNDPISSTPRKSSTINSPSRSTRWTSSLGCCLPSFFCFWCWA